MKKILLSIITSVILTAAATALPGFQSYLPDNSGEYVFYKDNSFTRESYVGLLYYDQSTVQIRYYAPQDTKALLPEKDIAILLTINPDAPYWEMTGERIISTIMPDTEDMDIVNYLHDFLYEFSAHRIKAGEITSGNEIRAQDYEQFGGSVTIVYDCRIPLFNIRYIEGEKNQKVLECVTIGQLKDSFDKSFDDFKGFPAPADDKSAKKAKQKKSKAEAVKYTFENQTITLDSDWTQPMENFWILGNNSMVTLGKIPVFDEADAVRNECYITRRILESVQNSYTDFASLGLVNNAKAASTRLNARIYQADTGKTVFTTKILTKNKDSSDFDYFSISTFEKPWAENNSYYQNIIKSYSN